MSLTRYLAAWIVGLWLCGLMRAHGRRFAANRRLARRIQGPVPDPPTVSISVIVPVKGDLPVEHLRAAEAAIQSCDADLRLVMESDQEPAYATARAYLMAHPASRWRIVLSGACPVGNNGKIHNLAAGIDASDGVLLLFVDADVALTASMVRHAASLLADSTVGAVFCPPYYEPSANAGAGLLAAYVNYSFMPSMARSDERGSLSYCAGACYGLRRETYRRWDLFHRHRDLISEDAALGQQVVGDGLAIRLVPAIARMPADRVSVRVALEHLRRWTLLGRVIAPGPFAQSLFTFTLPTFMLFLALGNNPPVQACLALLAFLWPLVFTRDMNRLFLGVPGPIGQACGYLVLDLLGPLLWLEAALTRRMAWRGRMYVLDHHGKIVRHSSDHPH